MNYRSLFVCVAGTELLNKFIRFQVNFQKLDSFCRKTWIDPWLGSLHSKTTNPVAWLKILQGVENC